MARAPRILIIDDNRPTLLLVQRVLAKHGYDVQTAPDGPTGLSLAQQARPDLIILDIMMPGMDGYEVCARLQNDPQTAVIPVLMLTAKGSLENLRAGDGRISMRVYDRMKGFQSGATDFLSKPVKAHDLLERVRSVLWSGNAQQ